MLGDASNKRYDRYFPGGRIAFYKTGEMDIARLREDIVEMLTARSS